MNLQVISKVYCLSHGMELLHAMNLQSTFIMHYALYNRLPREPEKCRMIAFEKSCGISLSVGEYSKLLTPISVLIFERILTVFLWDVIMCFIWEEEFYVKRS